MEQPNQQPSVKAQVLSHIESSRTHMRPGWYFFFHAVLFLLLLCFVLGVLVYSVSFAVFAMQQSGVWMLPRFGWRGVPVLLAALPWVVLAIITASFLAAEVLLRRYAFAYRRPMIVLGAGVFLFTGIGSFIIMQVHAHERLKRIVVDRDVPIMGRVYRSPREKQFRSFHPGVVMLLGEDGFLLRHARGDELTVRVTPQTRLAPGMVLRIGDDVVVLGPRSGSIVEAKDILFARPFPR